MEGTIERELRDPEAMALALLAAAASYFMVHAWEMALIALAGTLTVRVMAGIVLHGTHPPPARETYPDLTPDETAVAWYVYRGRGDPAIARRTGLSLKEVRQAVRRMMRAWQITTREELARHVADLIGEEPPDRAPAKKGREWMGEFGVALGIVAVGLGLLAVSPDTAVLGGVRDWLGLSLMAIGVVFAVVTSATYLWEKRHQ